VPNNHHLLRRNGVYTTVAVIQFSLKTRDLKQARQQRELCDIDWSARFSEVSRNRHGDYVSPKSRTLSRADSSGSSFSAISIIGALSRPSQFQFSGQMSLRRGDLEEMEPEWRQIDIQSVPEQLFSRIAIDSFIAHRELIAEFEFAMCRIQSHRRKIDVALALRLSEVDDD
jgi:hypothetical protein